MNYDFMIASFNCHNDNCKKENNNRNKFLCKNIIGKLDDEARQNGTRLGIIALQEFAESNINNFRVEDNGKETKMPEILKKNLSLHWHISAFRNSDRNGCNDSGYAILFNDEVFSLVDHTNDKRWKELLKKWHKENVEFGSGWGAKSRQNGRFVDKDKIYRPPQIVCFKPNKNKEAEIRIINTHIRFGDKESFEKWKQNLLPEEDIKASNSNLVKVRKSELKTLLKIYEEMNQEKIESHGIHNIHTILLGDFNLRPKEIKSFSSRELKFLEVLQNRKTTLSVYEEKGTFANSYDHFLLNNKITKKYADAYDSTKIIKDLKIDEEDYKDLDNIAKHYHYFSDHIPIKLYFSYR